jgi:transcriptional regulator with XRE-family HTH domain
MRGAPDIALADVLRARRKAIPATQEDIAHDAGITSSALSRIERGRNDPGWATVCRLARALGVTMAELASKVEAWR